MGIKEGPTDLKLVRFFGGKMVKWMKNLCKKVGRENFVFVGSDETSAARSIAKSIGDPVTHRSFQGIEILYFEVSSTGKDIRQTGAPI